MIINQGPVIQPSGSCTPSLKVLSIKIKRAFKQNLNFQPCLCQFLQSENLSEIILRLQTNYCKSWMLSYRKFVYKWLLIMSPYSHSILKLLYWNKILMKDSLNECKTNLIHFKTKLILCIGLSSDYNALRI